MNLVEIGIILKVYLISLLWQFISWPLVSWYFKGLVDRGWALCRVLTTLGIALIVWQLGFLGFDINNDYWVWSISILACVTSFFIYRRRGLLKRDEIHRIAKFIGVEEYLFVIGLAGMVITRGFTPDIHGLEKFMDFGFINRYLVSGDLPTMDMWFAGKDINYYSFGHFWASILIRMMMVTPSVGYNLVLGIILGVSLASVFSLAANLISKSETGKFVGGLIASMVVCIGGNSHAFWYFLTHKFTMNDYWYAEATRFIYNTIHEFPGYSFVVSDLHGHLLDLPMVLAFLIVFYFWTKNKKVWEEIVMGALFGIMAMTNTWDLPVYGMLLGFHCLFELVLKRNTILNILRTAAIILLTIVIVASPWWVRFEPISSGIGIVQLRSPIWQLAVLWGSGLLSVILAVFASKKEASKIFIWSLAVSAICLVLIPELIYAKDIYPNHPRANTMFKLTYQGFIFMGICLGVAVGQGMGHKRSILKFIGIFLGLIIFTGSMIFPVEAFPSFYGDYQKHKGLDGEQWLKNTHPERYAVVLHLRSFRNGKNLVEAVGDSYTDYNAISVFSGVPTVVGWRVHEWLWRGGYGPVGDRDAEVKAFYEDNDSKKTEDFLKKYDIGWIVLGSDEREKYKVNEAKIKSLGEEVLKEGKTRLLKVR